MSVDKLVDSTQLNADLTSVANAIRTKGGTSASLAFPAGFVSAIDAIPTGGGSSGIMTFDFTKSVYDQETGTVEFVLTNATRDSAGLHLGAYGSRAVLSNLNLYSHVVEVEIGELDKQFSGQHGRFIMSSGGNGLIYRNTSSWEVYTGGSWVAPATVITDPDYFENATVRIEYPSSGQNVAIYKDSTQIFSSIQFGASDFYKQLLLGSDANAYYNATIKKCTIYTNEAYALKVLLGG